MIVVTPKTAAAVQVTPAPAPVRQAEPTAGGSYTRNPATGDLVKNMTPTAQPAKE